MTTLSAAFLLFLVFDPMGNTPFFLVVLKDLDERRRKKIILRELMIALLTLILFLSFGRYFLPALQVSQSSLSVAGGIILFLIAIKMIFSGVDDLFHDTAAGDPFIVPLAIPAIAGPSAMATLLLLMAREPERWMDWLFALIIAWIASGIILYYSNALIKILGHRALVALERLMGLILTVVAVEMFLVGIRDFFQL